MVLVHERIGVPVVQALGYLNDFRPFLVSFARIEAKAQKSELTRCGNGRRRELDILVLISQSVPVDQTDKRPMPGSF